MRNLGFTRSANRLDHYVQTPDTFVRAPLPGMSGATAIVHIGPVTGAGFTQYTAEMQAAGTLDPTDLQRFLYVLDGLVEIDGRQMEAGGYAYVPPGAAHRISAGAVSRVAVIEKRLVSLGDAPDFFVAHESEIPSQALMGDPSLQVRVLIPDRPQFDFAVNTMTYEPGASLSIVEMHVMEHGLLMLEGGGIYRLGDCWYPVSEGDFIYMAPFCLQWFGALGKKPAKYLIYKDWNRHPAA